MFTFSGDYEWACWTKGVKCHSCADKGDAIVADGVQVENVHQGIVVTPKCTSCVTGGMFIEFKV